MPYGLYHKAKVPFGYSTFDWSTSLDILWVLTAGILVFTMQAGFLCLESGFVRSKNSINVAAKNIADFTVSSAIFWAVGFGIMFGDSGVGLFGTTDFFFGEDASPIAIASFLFQMMFCGTAATLVSGAVAERMKFNGYLIVTVTITLFIYPVCGHWAWAGVINPTSAGWLERIGFVDFAGSTIVHSVGGWVALAAILVLGPRLGRFANGDRTIPGSNIPMAVLGCMLIWFGWFGFNGGSTLAWTDDIPKILLNTCLAACWGGIAAGAIRLLRHNYVDVQQIVNGVLGGLVAITANCDSVTTAEAALIGIVGGTLVHYGDILLNRLKIDDSVGVIPVHLFAGIWGTLAVALFGDTALLETGLTSLQQLWVQSIGIVAVGSYSFSVAFVLLKTIDKYVPLRAHPDDERAGLNVAEHRVSTEVFDLLQDMQNQQQNADFSTPVAVEPFTEVGQIAQQYNRVIDRVNDEIRQRDEAFLAFRQSEYRNGAILNAAMDCIVSIRADGEIIEFNPAAEQCFGISKRYVVGKNFFFLYFNESLRPMALKSLDQGFMLSEGLILKRTNVTELDRSSGESFPAEIVVTRTTYVDSARAEYTLHIRDITQQVKLQKRLRFLAYHDNLTGLANRNYFVETLKQRIAFHQTSPGAVLLMFIDLDNFKKINDNLGHKTGDLLLCEVAARLSAALAPDGIVGRWGGDEFVILLSGEVDLDAARKIATNILQQMRAPIQVKNQSLTILCSIGVAFADKGLISADRLLQQADLAMYKAKQAGRNTYRAFSPELETLANQRFQLEVAIPDAIVSNQFVLHYQPKLTCASNTVIGFEALLRWQHPVHGLLEPDRFIPIIEESALMTQVEQWVIETAIKQLAQWRASGIAVKPIAINISGHHLYSNRLASFVKAVLEKHQISGDMLEFEITESVLVDHTDGSSAALNAIKNLNIKLAIDDFGTGYSSLSYLKRFPVDVLKVDRAFISECTFNPEDSAICAAIINVAKSIGLETVAEGVESEAQLSFLKQLDCTAYQGFLFSKALLPDDAIKLLTEPPTSPPNQNDA